MSDLSGAKAELSMNPPASQEDLTLIVQSRDGKMGFSGRISKEAGGATDKASRGSEVALRASWCKVRVRFLGNPARFEIKSIGVPKKSPDFCGGQSNCDALACMVKLIYLMNGRRRGRGSWLSG